MSTPERQASDKQAEQMKERLDEFEGHIQEVRQELEELEHTEDRPRYYESGDTPSEDDQTIALPG